MVVVLFNLSYLISHVLILYISVFLSSNYNFVGRVKCMLMEPPLVSAVLIRCALYMVQFIPEDLFEEMVLHTFAVEGDI